MSFTRRLGTVSRMVKIEHSVFALPFAYAGAFLAAGGWPGWRVFLLLTAAMVAVRSFAMAFNRLADLRFDMDNPRTRDRPLVTGELSVTFTTAFTAACALVFVLACALLNPLCLYLSVPALAWSAFYSYTKRFTYACHFVLGSVLGLAPVAGWISYEPKFTLAAVLLFLAVTFWVAGFDMLYSLQDREWDRERGLHSIPARFGVSTTLALSSFSHVNAGLFFLLAGGAADLGLIYYLTALVACVFLLWQHLLITAENLSRINLAFFTLNGFISLGLFAGVVLDLVLAGG